MTTDGQLHNARERVKELEDELNEFFDALENRDPERHNEQLLTSMLRLRKLVGREYKF